MYCFPDIHQSALILISVMNYIYRTEPDARPIWMESDIMTNISVPIRATSPRYCKLKTYISLMVYFLRQHNRHVTFVCDSEKYTIKYERKENRLLG
jgi:hypothetical protein